MLPGYVRFQLQWAERPLLNIGCGGNMAGFAGPDVCHLDLDVWNYPNFVHGDAHRLPFRSDSFACAVLGDILEHVLEPAQVLAEARRVAPRVVMTTFQEWRLGGVGRYVERGQELFAPVGDGGLAPFIAAGQCRRSTPESVQSHVPHIWQWDRELLLAVIDRAGLVVEHEETDCPGVHEGHPMLNYLFVLRRRR